MLIGILEGSPEWYRSWATEYNELEIPMSAVVAVYQFQPMTEQLALSLNPEAFIEDVIGFAEEIGYPVADKKG